MKIGLIELDTRNHKSLIYNWIKISQVNNWSCTLFTNETIYTDVKENLDSLEYTINLKNNEESVLTYLWRIRSHLKRNHFDVVIILTLQTHFLEFIAVNFSNVRVGLTIHNCKTWFDKNNIRKFSHLLKRLCRKIWVKQADFYVVNSDNMKQYLLLNFPIQKEIYVVPFSLRRDETPRDKDSKFTVTYPGMISLTRKIYDNFITLAERFPFVNFVLLGAPNPEEGGLEVIDKINNKKIQNIHYYLDYVSEEEFNIQIRRSSVLFNEINIKYINSDFEEIYGLTKDSGISYLMYEYGIPTFLNQEFTNLPYLQQGTIYFSSFSELENLFNHLFQEKATLEILETRLRDSSSIVNIYNTAHNLLSIIKKN